MTDFYSYIAATAIGAALAFLFLLILWRSVRRLGKFPQAGYVMLAELVFRHGIVYSTFYAIVNLAGWTQLLSAVLGFAVVRVLLVRHIGRSISDTSLQKNMKP